MRRKTPLLAAIFRWRFALVAFGGITPSGD